MNKHSSREINNRVVALRKSQQVPTERREAPTAQFVPQWANLMRAAPAPELCRSRRMARLAMNAGLQGSIFRPRARVLFSRGCSGRLAPEQGRLLREETPVSGDQELRSRSAVRMRSFGPPPSREGVLLALEIQSAERFFVPRFSLLGERWVRGLVKERWLLRQAPAKV